MKRNLKVLFLSILGLFLTSKICSQDFLVHELGKNNLDDTTCFVSKNVDSTLKLSRNYLILNVGFFELNINYERNIIYHPFYITNIKIGFGEGNDLQGGYAEYLASFVQLLGGQNSHVEFNLGYKYTKNHKENFNSSVSSSSLYFFAGYRFEKPDGHFIFHAGFNYPSIVALSLGIGIKF